MTMLDSTHKIAQRNDDNEHYYHSIARPSLIFRFNATQPSMNSENCYDMLDRHHHALDMNMARMTFELRNQHDTTINLRSMRIRNESVAGINHLQSLRGGDELID